MNTLLAIGFAIVLIAGGWIAWRYVSLRRGIANYARELGQSTASHEGDAPDLADLSRAVAARVADLESRVSSLNTAHARLAAVLDQMADGVIIADSNGLVQFTNPAARRLFDTPDPLGRTVTEVLRNHQLVQAWQRSLQTGELQSESVDVTTRRQYLQLIAMPDIHSGGSLLLVQDLTRIRRLETVRRDFVSNISHELRTPLASLKALTETLQGGALSDPEAGSRFLDRIVTEVDALTQMAQELLDLSRIESGQVALQVSTVVPRDLLQSATERMSTQAERAGLVLRVECRDDLPRLHADASRLEQVLVNLIHNAVKFTRPGGHVVLSAQAISDREGGRSVRFEVADSGAGIPEDDIPRIFERFYRVDKSRASGGTGLGLSIARHIVEAHGGEIWAESAEGQGSQFYFSIPIT